MGNFPPCKIAFHILKKNIEDMVTKSTSIWKIMYGLSTKAITERGEKEEKEPKKDEEEKDKEVKIVKKGNVEGTKGA